MSNYPVGDWSASVPKIKDAETHCLFHLKSRRLSSCWFSQTFIFSFTIINKILIKGFPYNLECKKITEFRENLNTVQTKFCSM